MKIFKDFEQGSLEWNNMRCGKISAGSRAKDLLAQGRKKGTYGRMRESYIMDVVSERLSGEAIDGYYGLDMERGNFLEEWGFKAFEQATGIKMNRVGYVLQDDERIGCSPDGLSDDAGIEIKSPLPRQHIRTIFEDGIEDYRRQAQGCMWVCERDRWYIVSFCPWVKQYPLYIKLVNRDRDMIDRLAVSAVDAANQVDALVEKALSIKGSEAIRELSEQARMAWESTLADNDGDVQL